MINKTNRRILRMVSNLSCAAEWPALVLFLGCNDTIGFGEDVGRYGENVGFGAGAILAIKQSAMTQCKDDAY